MLSERRLRFKLDLGGEVGDGGMAVGRGGEDMKSATGLVFRGELRAAAGGKES